MAIIGYFRDIRGSGAIVRVHEKQESNGTQDIKY